MSDLAIRTELDALTIANQVQQLKSLGQTLVSSGLMPAAIKTPEAAVVIILKGRELGIPPLEAINSINVIQGKPTVAPQLMLALIERSKQGYIEIVERADSHSIVKAVRKGRTPVTFKFTLEDAKRLGLAEKDNWRKQPAVMLQWRNVAAAARAVFPDVISGVYTPEEMGADVEIGDDEGMTVIEAPVAPPQPLEAVEMITANQTKALAIALKEAGFDTSEDGKQSGRDFVAFVAGVDRLSSIKDLTRADAQTALDNLGSGENGSYRADKAKLEAELDRWSLSKVPQSEAQGLVE